MGKHLAALGPEKQQTLSVQERETPEPGPNELLLEVKAVASNPVDFYQRDYGMPPVPVYPRSSLSTRSSLSSRVRLRCSRHRNEARLER